MVVRIVIAGVSQCEIFAEVCLVADHLAQNLPNFFYERIEKPVLDWKAWLCKINQKNKWHHSGSPLVWKELLIKGSKPYYIGGASEFLDYCHSYYEFDKFFCSEKFEGLVNNYKQYQKKIKEDQYVITQQEAIAETEEQTLKQNFVVCISGAGCPLTMHLISGLLDMSMGEKSISRIYIYDNECSKAFMEFVEKECSYIRTSQSGKIVKYVEKIGSVLTHSDLYIILDHIAFDPDSSIGEWLYANKKVMQEIALTINASASRKMYILLPNVGPACFNATVLMNHVTNINKNNIVVATSDLGLDVIPIMAETAQVPMKNIFCPPVWGFVGVNHLVDIRTTVHKYNSFEPYNRFIKVKNSTLTIGSLTPEMRTMEYLMYFDDSLWIKIANKKNKIIESLPLNKAVAALNTVKLWLFDPDPNYIINLGIRCNGSFGLTFKGVFSQPARFIDGEWCVANDFLLPKDPQMSLKYLEQMAFMAMSLQKKDLPKIVPYYPCSCKRRVLKKKEVW